MVGSWRNLLPALVVALLIPTSAARALDEAALLELEGLLRDLGFDPGPVDGIVSDETIAAIRRYQEFAVLTGEPEPSAQLLDELRGVAAAFAALNASKPETRAAEAPVAPPPVVPDPGAGPEAPVEPAPQADAQPEAEPAPELVAEKVIVPPPPPPPKLKPLEVTAETEPQVAALPPADSAPTDAAPADATPALDSASEPNPADAAQAALDAELAPYRGQLKDGSLTREALSRQFNDEGRKLLQQAQYDDAVLKFSVAIHLDPNFAGAYSNRGTAYQRLEETELAKADFDRSKQLGFGGVRLENNQMPLK